MTDRKSPAMKSVGQNRAPPALFQSRILRNLASLNSQSAKSSISVLVLMRATKESLSSRDVFPLNRIIMARVMITNRCMLAFLPIYLTKVKRMNIAAAGPSRYHGQKKLWAAHFAGRENEYCHMENLINLESIPRPYGFTVAVFPVKIENAGGGWVCAVAPVE